MKPHVLSILAALAMLSGVTANATPISATTNPSDPVIYDPSALLVSFRPHTGHITEARLLDAVGGAVDYEYTLVPNLVRVRLSGQTPVEEAIAALKDSPFVEYAEPDFIVHTQDDPPPPTNDPLYGQLWGLDKVRAPDAWTRGTGSNDIVVAVIDTGADFNHPDLTDNIWANPGEIPGNGIDDDGNGYIDDVHGWDFYDYDNNPMDGGAHGTHVSGTICAKGNNEIGVTGVTWDCQLMILRFMGPSGGSTSDAIMALEYAVNRHARISNNSWGNGELSNSLRNAIRKAGSSGHLFVAAAGNSRQNIDDTPFYPAAFNLDNIISVAAIDSADHPAGFSNWGPTSVDLHAPGVAIVSTVPLQSYASSNGTSMAAPYVTGAAALLLSMRPELTTDELSSLLLATTRPVPELAGLTATGGELDVAAAAALVPMPPAAPSDLAATVTALNRDVELTWIDNSDDEAGQYLWRSVDETNWTTLAALPPDVTAYSDCGLGSGTYFYKVQSFNDLGVSEFSNVASVTLEREENSVHVGDLDATTRWVSRNTWTATLTVLVHDGEEQAVPNVTVKGLWSERNAMGSCTTNALGQCQITSPDFKQNVAVASYTVFGLVSNTIELAYVPADNHDPDGDSTGTAISVAQP
ncbi:MAG: S8 family serine peptidase [Caldilineales bacterium]